ncbi:hypothetical protein FHS96_005617 [Sphingomonas zeicaulis]|uniref:DUF5818 domain-containing protein n=1 Tax=Sphingomonas zeicaulis TaxID=1632740 RepID=UPI003D23A63B
MDGSRLRLTGLVESSPRGPLLKLDDCTRWRLAGDPVDPDLIDRIVLVEGIVQGSTISLDYIAAHKDGGQCR